MIALLAPLIVLTGSIPAFPPAFLGMWEEEPDYVCDPGEAEAIGTMNVEGTDFVDTGADSNLVSIEPVSASVTRVHVKYYDATYGQDGAAGVETWTLLDGGRHLRIEWQDAAGHTLPPRHRYRCHQPGGAAHEG